ncbi:2TM domain-containing protein [Flavobacterium wongokense]|uniref:2TM domain-containing protein n=1 Tax=Flavobacterium wongokense TaxID=2910674 RepID=UPI001F1A433B|nr:2TM domain-containing protein [Flavobacterium sp. WG47]MCF6132580.1 2TM domain-containing protein [Flavobacterium sp. WG47]
MKPFQNLLPKTLLLTVIIFIAIQLLNVILGNQIHFNYNLAIAFGYCFLYTFLLSYANWGLFYYLDRIFQSNRFSTKRIIIGFFGSFSVTLIVIFLLRTFEEVIVNQKSFDNYLKNESPANYIVSVVITFIVSLSFYAFYFFKAYNDSKVKEQKIIAGTASAQFESLKNQIDPHFLFNSLNVLSSLIEENPDNAQRFTTSLSKIYRYVLEQKDKELVSVSEELAFAKTYMNLLKMRFENSITYEIPTDFDNAEAKVVPLSLQLLLENTIKHNVVSEQKPLHIKIYIENNYLIVENNLQKKEVLQDRRGVGLQNIVNRYGLISERKMLIEQNENYFKVKIPILTKQIAFMETQNIYNENMAFMRAKDRVEKLKGFYGNLISYCCVIPVLIFINLRVTGSFQWFWFPMFGWGMGLCFHAIETFGYGKSWEEKKIQEILNKDKQTKWN